MVQSEKCRVTEAAFLVCLRYDAGTILETMPKVGEGTIIVPHFQRNNRDDDVLKYLTPLSPLSSNIKPCCVSSTVEY
jgi:hypothetical protein